MSDRSCAQSPLDIHRLTLETASVGVFWINRDTRFFVGLFDPPTVGPPRSTIE
jgi:hypothetical protein